jgi:hypothetical protein
MGKLENLRPWQPGQSGNPGGRPKKRPLTELYEEFLSDGSTVKAIRAAILKNLKCGKTAFVPLLREMADRVEGKVTQSIDSKVTEVSQLSDDELRNELQRLMEELHAAEHARTED